MILSGPEIRKQHATGRIEIDPFDDEQVNPASYDLRLGNEMGVYKFDRANGYVLDAAKEHGFDKWKFDEVILEPGRLYLMHTAERVCTKEYVPIVDGKSSIGRLGVFVHVTAGYGDPGFNGQYTLEVIVTHPTKVYAGMRFAQIRFHSLEGVVQLYDGNYAKEFWMGPQPSRSWRQIEKDRERKKQ